MEDDKQEVLNENYLSIEEMEKSETEIAMGTIRFLQKDKDI